MSKKTNLHIKSPLWVALPVKDILEIYANWAASYDDDRAKAGYGTPDRIAAALAKSASPNSRILDFGCGTGLSGIALKKAGFTKLDGVDISQPMLDKAQKNSIYQKIWLGQLGKMTGVDYGQYDVIVAAGVLSLRANPPETLSIIIDHLAARGLIALSFNEPTLEDGFYDHVLDSEIALGRISLISREHGPHLQQQQQKMGSDVIVLKRL